MKMATELTPLNDQTHAYYYSSSKHHGDRFAYFKYAWSQISEYFWKCAILLFGLLVVNIILKSIFFKQTSLMFTSTTNDNLSNFDELNVIDGIQPNIIWIVTANHIKLNEHTQFLNKLVSNSVLLEEYYVSPQPATPSMNRMSSLISKYTYKLTENDMNAISCFDAFLSQKYQIKKLYDDTVTWIEDEHSSTDSAPFLMYIQLDDEDSMKRFDDKIKQIVSYYKAKRNVDIWQNSVLIISSDYNKNENGKSFALLSGPRVPSKKRGTTYLNAFHSVDWTPTLLDSIGDDVDGFDLWDSIIYNKLSPRTNIPSNRNEQIHKMGMTQNIKI